MADAALVVVIVMGAYHAWDRRLFLRFTAGLCYSLTQVAMRSTTTRGRLSGLGMLVLLTYGCSAYTLHNPTTGQRVHCGWVPMAPWWTYKQAEAEVFRELDCIEGYRLAGYEFPTATPPYYTQTATAVRPPEPAPAPSPPVAAPGPPEPTPPPPSTSAEPAPPAAAAEARPEVGEFKPTERLRDIFFDFDESRLRPQEQASLDANITWLRSNPSYLVLIEGHCDERGTNEYNLALGEQRARATRNYLIAHGIDPSRITTFSYGEERPFCVDRTEQCWAQNRRAHFLVKPR